MAWAGACGALATPRDWALAALGDLAGVDWAGVVKQIIVTHPDHEEQIRRELGHLAEVVANRHVQPGMVYVMSDYRKRKWEPADVLWRTPL